MNTRSKTKKRQREIEEMNNDNDGNNEESKQEEPPKKKRKVSSSAQLMSLSQYKCCICLDLPQNEINQCGRGHIICSDCYPQINNSKCPQCRTSIDMDNPIRNRLAEESLKLRVTTCDIDGCDREIIFGKLKHHKQNECEYIPTKCKFKDIGCEWEGIRKDNNDHEQNCKLDQNKILEFVNKMKHRLEKGKVKKNMLFKITHSASLVFEEEIRPEYDYNEAFDAISIDHEHVYDTNSGQKDISYSLELKCELNENGDNVIYSRILSSAGIETLGIAIQNASCACDHDEACEQDCGNFRFSFTDMRSVENKEWIPFQNVISENDEDKEIWLENCLYVKLYVTPR